VDYYFWGWSKPESIVFGGQVQDGGAVLGWSFMDLSSRLKVNGPDDAWLRLREIAHWFDEVQAGGGYREYYKKQGAALPGDGAAGGLGMDREFFESLLVPQIVLRGFLGFAPTADGCRIEPKLPPRSTTSNRFGGWWNPGGPILNPSIGRRATESMTIRVRRRSRGAARCGASFRFSLRSRWF
jgi:hypothetical protein